MKMEQFGLKTVALCSLILVVAGCTSALEKQCKETNWFAHGEEIAMKGERVTGDGLVTSCEKEDYPVDHSALDLGFKKGMQRYCTPEQTYLTGKAGEPFRSEMCEGMNMSVLRSEHQKGIHDFCQKENGQRVGSTGQKYKGVCPKDLEKAFLPEYNKGRKGYLTSFADEKEREALNVEREIIDLERKRNDIQNQMNGMATTRVVTRQRVYDPVTRTEREQTVSEEDPELKRQKERLGWDIQDVNREIERKREQQRQIRAAGSAARSEAAGL